MARKIFRRKKNGREVGQWYVRDKAGKPVALGTKDAREANRRASLFERGKWPPAEAAAKVARAAEFVPEAIEDSTSAMPEGVATEAASPPVPPSPAVPPPLKPETRAAAVHDEPDAAAAAAAAAAEAAGVGGGDAAQPDADEEARRSAWSEQFASAFGTDLGAQGLSPGAILAGVEWKVLSGLYARRAARMSPPRYVVVKAEDVAIPVGMLASAWDEQIRRWGLDLGKVEPWMAIVGGTIGLVVACAAGTTTTPPTAEGQDGGNGVG